jgi:16S rRNA (cytosine1402-N4)-methyltransferase
LIIIDGTLGGGGHSAEICCQIKPGGFLIGIDQDKDAIENAKIKLRSYASDIHLSHDNFANLPDILANLNIAAVDGIVLDLGLSFHHLKYSGRGFSFAGDEPLDMRMDVRTEITAEDIVNKSDFKELRKIFFVYGEERRASIIARKIIREREKSGHIHTNRQLAQIICNARPSKAHYRKKTIHPATKVFMALRIAVNQELEKLEVFMSVFSRFLKPQGRLCVLSFHSLEDRIVKQHFNRLAKECICPKDFPICVCRHKSSVRILTKKILRPSASEIQANPMARSAKMRVVEKL